MPVIDQNTWGGVCGFVSVLHGLQQRQGFDARGRALTADDLHQWLGAEMAGFLKVTRHTAPARADAILRYTQSFGPPYDAYTYEGLVRLIENLARDKAAGPVAMTAQNKIGVALPLEGLFEYLDFAGVRYNPVITGVCLPFTQDEMRKHKDCVVGVGNKKTVTNAYHGLRHWVYVDADRNLWNWGSVAPMAASVGRPYEDHPTLHDAIVHVVQLL